MSADALLEVEDLHAGYVGPDVVRGVNLSLREGSFTALLGSNGAGKTTTLGGIMGLVPRCRGSVVLDGERLDGRSPSAIVRKGIALAPEGRQLFSNLTVIENLTTGSLARGGRRHRGHDLDAVFSYFPLLADRRDQRAGTLSGGEQQMVTIGRALMSRPRLLIIDEASLGLAPIMVETLFDLIASINRDGVTVLAVEQNIGLLDRADHVVVLEHGEIAFSGQVADVKGTIRDEIRRAYLGTSG